MANAFVGRLRVDHRLHQERGPTSPSDSPRPGPRRWSSSTANPAEARKHLLKNTFTPDDVVDTVPMIGYFMVERPDRQGQGRTSRSSSTSRRRSGRCPRRSTSTKYMQSVLTIDGPPSRAAGAHAGRATSGRRAARRRSGCRRTSPIRGLSKRFGNAVIYDNFDLDIPRGELVSVFGPNGCGKSTLINMIAGLIPADAGRDPVRRHAAEPRSSSATCSRTIARRCFPGCARSTTSTIRSS